MDYFKVGQGLDLEWGYCSSKDGVSRRM